MASARMLSWTQFAKEYQKKHNLSYTEALKQAGSDNGPWRQYQKKFMKDHPKYDAKAVAAQIRKEREEKIASGEIPAPRSRKSKKQIEVEKKKSDTTQQKKKEDDDDDYEEITTTTTTVKKRKRVEEVTTPPPKPKRKRYTPKKKISNDSVVPKGEKLDADSSSSSSQSVPPPLTVKTPGKALPLPKILIKKKKSPKSEYEVKKESCDIDTSDIPLGQEIEEEFIPEYDSSKERNDEESQISLTQSNYVSDYM